MTNNHLSIEVILSTLNEGIFNINLNPSFNYLIVHQVTDPIKNNAYDEYINNIITNNTNNIRYIRSQQTGLSRSRNLGLHHATGDFLWIMDDDVIIHEDARKRINKYLKNHDADLFILNYSSDINKKYSNKKEGLLNFLSIPSISSINMLIKNDLPEKVFFDENFGLGTNFPSGEEYIFSCDLLKQKRRIWQTDLVVSFHPPITSGQDFFTTPHKLATKKHMFIRGLGYIPGYILYILFIIKKLPIIIKNKSTINIIKSFFI